MKPASAKPAPGHHRCFYRSAAGRQCRSWVIDPRGMFCPRHCAAKPNGPDDFAFHLLQRSCGFQNGEGIRDSLSRLYSLLAADLITPRRAAVLGYLTSLLLRTLPTIYNDPYPQAGTPMSAAQLAEPNPSRPQLTNPPHPKLPRPRLPRNPRSPRNPSFFRTPSLLQRPSLLKNPSFIKRLFRNLPRNHRPNIPLIPHHQSLLSPLPRRQRFTPQLPITSPKAPAPCRPLAPNSPPKSSNP